MSALDGVCHLRGCLKPWGHDGLHDSGGCVWRERAPWEPDCPEVGCALWAGHPQCHVTPGKMPWLTTPTGKASLTETLKAVHYEAGAAARNTRPTLVLEWLAVTRTWVASLGMLQVEPAFAEHPCGATPQVATAKLVRQLKGKVLIHPSVYVHTGACVLICVEVENDVHFGDEAGKEPL